MGVQTAHQTELGAETAYHVADHAVYSHKLKAYDKAEKLVSKSDKANVNALFEKFKRTIPMLLPILFHDGSKSITSRRICRSTSRKRRKGYGKGCRKDCKRSKKSDTEDYRFLCITQDSIALGSGNRIVIHGHIRNVFLLLYHVPGRYAGSVGNLLYCGR